MFKYGIEIYNENVIDLLNNESSPSSSLMIIEDPNKGVYCPNIKEYVISNSLELKKLFVKEIKEEPWPQQIKINLVLDLMQFYKFHLKENLLTKKKIILIYIFPNF